jgi:hypothetical protein
MPSGRRADGPGSKRRDDHATAPGDRTRRRNVIRIRTADAADEPRLRAFIHDHWSSTHIFVERPEVFRWQYLQDDGRFNMVLAEDTNATDDGVLGVLGFIPLGRFDPALGDRDVLLAIWKVR